MKYEFKSLTAEQYCRLVTLGENPDTADVIWALTGKKKDNWKIKDLKKVRFGNLDPYLDPFSAKFFVVDGILYGFQDMGHLSFGLFTDIAEAGKDIQNNLLTMMSYLYRPVTKMSRWNRFKLRLIAEIGKRANSVFAVKTMYKITDSIQYEIEEYDPMKCDLRIKQIRQAPATAAHATASFFLIFLRESQLSSLRSMSENLSALKKSLIQEAISIRDKPKQT